MTCTDGTMLDRVDFGLSVGEAPNGCDFDGESRLTTLPKYKCSLRGAQQRE